MPELHKRSIADVDEAFGSPKVLGSERRRNP
jgi:hypothetical protein